MTTRILLDGPDFAGKSTICAILARDLAAEGVSVLHTVGAVHPVLAKVVSAVHRSEWLPSRARGLFYLGCPLLERAAAVSLLRRERGMRVHLIEGGYDRVTAFHLARGERRRARWVSRCAWPPPDLAFFLDASEEARAARYRCSGGADDRDRDRFQGSGLMAHRRHCAELRALSEQRRYLRVDTSRETAPQSAQRVRRLITRRIDEGGDRS